jgi:predicted DNA-binding transcriptional regulator YafY
MSDSVARQVYALSLIPRYPRSVPTTFIKHELNEVGFHAPIRTVQRDLVSLTLRWPMICDDSSKPFRWSWEPDASGSMFPVMDPAEALTIALAEQHLKSLLPNNSYRKIETYFKQARQTLSTIDKSKLRRWTQKVRVFPRGQPLQMATIRKDIEQVIYEALLNDTKVRVLYRKRYATVSSEYIISPLGLVSRNAVHYLVCAVDHDPGSIRYLPLHRFTKAVDLYEPAEIPEGFSLDSYLETNPLGFLRSVDPVNLEVIFSAEAAYHLSETPLNKTQSITQTRDGRVRIKATVADTSELRFWILGFGSSAEVIRPTSLRKELSETSKEMHKVYTN